MIDKKKAVELAEAYLVRNTGNTSQCGSLVLWDEKSREVAAGWLFYWQSSEFLRTRHPALQLIGGGPILVDREDGSIHPLHPVRLEQQLRRYLDKRRAVKIPRKPS